MSGLSDHLHSGQTGAPVGCGGTQAEEKGCVGGLEGLDGPELWTRELRLQDGSQAPSNDGLAPVTPDHFPPSSASALANGLHLQRRLGHGPCRRRQTETHTTADTHLFAETLRNMQTHIDPDVHEQAHVDNCGNMDINAHTVSVGPEHSRTLSPEAIHTSPQPLSLALGNHPASTNQLTASVLTAETDIPSNLCPVPIGPNPNTGSSPLPVEAEKKYALRSSGRPRFPCHLRKSSRLRRSTEDGEKRAERERGGEEEDEALEEKIWRVKEEEVVAVKKEEHLSVEAVLPTAPCPTDIALALTVPKQVPKAIPKPGPRLGHKPGPKSRSRPAPKSVHKAGPKSVMKQRQAAQSIPHRATPHLPFTNTSTITAPRLTVQKDEPVAEVEVSTNNRRRGRFVGVRKIVVKVARIPVSLSRRQKSYKISNLETVTGTEKSNDGSLEGEAVREPTALLRMKNNGKSVMVMFPPGELPVILKRRRGRPPKQALPGIPGEPPNTGNAGNSGGNGDQPKKPRRRRRTKLPCPYPSYVNDTNDVKMEYGDVLSKLAFLNRQPPASGRCSPPRCWTPSEPESFHTPLENPGISTLLHRLTGFRRPRGGRGGGIGRGGGAAGGIGGSERNKSTFSDFFESIGKKRKLSPMSEHGLPRKRGKGVGGGGVGRGGGIVGTEPGGEKIVKKRRVRKNGAFKGEGVSMGQDWPNGAGGWGEEGGMDKEKGLGGYQLCGSPRGGFSSCEIGRGGAYSSPGGSRGGGPAGEDSQGLFAGYFRSLLDSDDSSDLLDISSSQSNPRKASSTPGYEPSSPATGQSWSPAFPKWGTKSASSGAEGSTQTHCSSARPPYSYGSLAQTSPTTSTYPKSTPPSLSHSPSSPHPASYGHYSSGYSSSSPAGVGAVPQRSSDCSFAYGAGHNSGKVTPVGQMGYSSYQAAKRGYSGYPAAGHSSMVRGESTGPTSPGGGYMSVAKGSPFSSSSSPEGFKQFNCNQWSYRQGYGGWSADGFGPQYHGYSEYGSNESKDILDISNYTPQKAKRNPFTESLSESSSDSSHLGSAAIGCGPTSTGGIYKQNEPVSVGGEGGQSSLSSLEKLMMDWHESASAPSYNWSQNVLFQGGGTSKPGRGRRKRTETQSEKEGGSALHSDSPSSPSPTPTPGPKRGVGGRGRGSRGGRGGLSPCQRERPSGAKGRGKAASTSGVGAAGTAGGPEGSGLFQEGLDYYSGDSSSLSPLATPNPAPPSSYLQDPCEYPSPYSAHPSTPSSEERYPALYPGESSSSLSPSVSSPPYPPKPTPPPPQSYHPVPSRTFSPSCSPSPRVTPLCGTALSPSHRPPPKESQFSQYDSPSYCSSPYWYGQTSHSGSPSPHSHSTHSNTAVHTHSNPHTSPHGNTHGNPLVSPNANTHTHMNPTPHDTHHHNTQPHANLSSHTKSHPNSHLQSNPLSHSNLHTNNQPHHNAHTNPNTHLPSHTHSNPSPSLHAHSTPLLYEERSPPSTMTPHKRDLTPHAISTGQRQGPLPLSPYPKPPLDSSPHQEDTTSYSLSHQSYQGMGHRYPSQAAQGSGVLCQLLDPTNDDSFSVTSL
ncbi:AT-hook DNA-binding motif-containing protein 1 [Thunnus maccoyii]|uniref:AT-hook DNA-binding motif-containing protein 1 n=1 Tax=Thunnus maccoyii TaxID=8240 RepID=UPI001C4DA3F1|nr:AT-hook DNA-binding motif-containing protein 1 [Thunnus maccoyii]XP_042291151.1 AT-hook DNA-binding motif-containing protein 1 [Thunnus maccoyii]XP_042291152.1 AT-hook DNA-binding motif-containing protein 1 [Thunnus maccoyii]XP_042291153.1 AT-hook DNA-binding motif-containing protein 1 [Thunnus maccoyii]XP_042291154.1 AT-hook DNA-binding motif-containing protein 1 [Thunnus maccoyii]XP_042291155.1 AT-hook DNA-binding motif-containing protein 1 [Thunnus maccoyii]XP_042291156.1 AT-hook DNA-bi